MKPYILVNPVAYQKFAIIIILGCVLIDYDQMVTYNRIVYLLCVCASHVELIYSVLTDT